MSEARDMPKESPRREEPARDRPMERPVDRPRTTAEPVRKPPEAMSQTEMMWPDMTEFRQKFDQIQSEFIENPKSAVQKAEHLIEEAVESMARSMRERMQSMHRDVEGKDGDTEQLRLTMRGYRTFMDSMADRASHRAA